MTTPEDAINHGFQIRVGAHKDTLWHLPEWRRAPQITRVFPIKTQTTRAANAFGGAVYIEVPEKDSIGRIKITLDGAVEAPYFVRGKTSHAEWLRQIGPRAFGCHVQDCIWPAQDHQPPFSGDVDLAKLVPLLPKDCAWVWEMSPRKTADEIQRSVETWKKRFGE